MLVVRSPKSGSQELEFVSAAVARGELVIVPTDTVYGIAASAADADAVTRLYAAKGRDGVQPTAVVFASIPQLREHMPNLSRRAAWAASALLPGPWTLIVRNPDEVFPWLTGGQPGPLGIRVPAGALDLPPIAASSANRAGLETPSTVEALDPELLAHVACVIDAGPRTGGLASTILDLTDWEAGSGDVRVIRDERGLAGQALAALAAAPSPTD